MRSAPSNEHWHDTMGNISLQVEKQRMHLLWNCMILLQLYNLLVQMLMKSFPACFHSQEALNKSFTAKWFAWHQLCYSLRVVWTLLQCVHQREQCSQVSKGLLWPVLSGRMTAFSFVR